MHHEIQSRHERTERDKSATLMTSDENVEKKREQTLITLMVGMMTAVSRGGGSGDSLVPLLLQSEVLLPFTGLSVVSLAIMLLCPDPEFSLRRMFFRRRTVNFGGSLR